MDTKYLVNIEVALTPKGIPCIAYGIDKLGEPILLARPTVLRFDLDLNLGEHKLLLELSGKANKDAETAVIIDSIKIEGMELDRAKWAGLYYPIYPESWAASQTDLSDVLTNCTYVGWNGLWVLEFTVPIFTWVHKLENLGWIYD
jgi:hypothetical protein